MLRSTRSKAAPSKYQLTIVKLPLAKDLDAFHFAGRGCQKRRFRNSARSGGRSSRILIERRADRDRREHRRGRPDLDERDQAASADEAVRAGQIGYMDAV